MDQQHLLSHSITTEEIDVAIQKIAARIRKHGDKPYATVDMQLDLLQQLSQFEFGRFLLLNQGINGYWTHYMLTYPWSGEKENLTSVERFILERSPTILATQERFEIFLKENQQVVKDASTLACIPSGMMGDLLYLNVTGISNIKFIGVDYDPNALSDAKLLADKQNLSTIVELNQGDAWSLHDVNKFDLISSNGLNIYEPDDARVTELYRTFYNALKPGGKLVTSFLTCPPTMSDACEWDMTVINEKDLLLQKIIFGDVLEAKWQCYRSSDQTKEQLESVGFEDLKFIYDRARLFPTVVAHKVANTYKN